MSVKIINYCKKTYKLNPEKLVSRILEKIPDKFLIHLGEIHLFDVRKDNGPHVKYIGKADSSQDAIIEIFMDDPTFHVFSFFSLVSFNDSFLMGMNEHIEKYVKVHSHDKEILSRDPLRVNYEWMFFGGWYPLFFVLFKIPHYLISKSRLFKKIARYLMNLVVKKVRKFL